MFKRFNRKLFTFLVTAVLVAFVSVYLHSCQSSSEPLSKTPQSSPSVVSSQSSPSPSTPKNCDENNQPDCQEKQSTLDWLLGAYATLGNSNQGFIVDFRDNAPDIKALGQVSHLKVSDVLPDEKTYLIQGGLEELNKLKGSGLAGYIRYIEPNYIYEQASGLVANDPYYSEQWNLKDIQLEEAWKTTKGEGITVAILDTGIVLVEDFDPNTFTKGYDFVSNPGKPIDVPIRDPEKASGNNAHGTNLAGIIAQATNNSLGFAGIAPKAKIMSVRVLNEKGIGDAATIAKGIEWAVNNGADVINCSFTIMNGVGSNTAIRDQLEYAKNKGVVVVAAAGNKGKEEIGYPASDKNAIAVAAYTPALTRAGYSNYGREVVIFAPGGQSIPNSSDKLSTDSLEQALCKEIGIATNNPLMDLGITQSWITKVTRRGDKSESQLKGQVCSGTSQATAGVSGVVALVKATGIKDPDVIKKILTASADKGCYDQSEQQSEESIDTQRTEPKQTAADSLNSESKRLEDKKQGKPEPEPSDPFDPGKIGRLNAGAAVKLARNLINPEMRDNIALAKRLTKIGAKFYESCECYIPKEIEEQFGPAAFSEINFVQIRHADNTYGWEIKGEKTSEVSLALEDLADRSSYSGSRNFVVPEQYRWIEEDYKKNRDEPKRARSQSTPN